ncbi:Lrp/AsnC family transcriptional regulator [Porticoccus sp. W117]|uniref:Lrp/AsnC family transcriptional regulator n=1 Tax=Porticoccus sp. W117 TaxID=3054777 RepID=UPI0025939E63|nr:Lrp/AsnC family transcriptional regulator [Porticoccus sp. W117]MDM3870408.1 Lrp/AsnC family transcriptional regulator [Porticoccus sp. W117]
MLDNTDRKLIALLRMNARLSTSELARQLDISRSTIQSRLRRLETRNIISGYTVQFNEGYEKRLLKAHVMLKLVQKLTGPTYVALSKLPQVTALYSISGEYDMITVLSAESAGELNQIIDQIGNLDGIERTNSSVILETKFVR